MSLIIFFNGWGMNDTIFKTIDDSTNFNYKIICINYPYIVPEIDFDQYDNIFFVGWSFGVYYLNKFLCENSQFDKYPVFSINGTPEILGNMGIPEKMMRFTMDTLTLESLGKFYENMGYNRVDSHLYKNISALKDEIGNLIKNYKIYDNKIKTAFIGENDRIVSSKNQKKYYTIKNIPFITSDIGHIPFDDTVTFIKIVENLNI